MKNYTLEVLLFVKNIVPKKKKRAVRIPENIVLMEFPSADLMMFKHTHSKIPLKNIFANVSLGTLITINV